MHIIWSPLPYHTSHCFSNRRYLTVCWDIDENITSTFISLRLVPIRALTSCTCNKAIVLFAMFQPLLFSSYTKALLSIQINIPPSYSARQLQKTEQIATEYFENKFLMSSQSNNKNFPEQMFIKRSGRDLNDNCNQSAKGGMAVVGR